MINSNYLFIKILNNLKYGKLRITFPNGKIYTFGNADQKDEVNIKINNKNAISAVISEGDIGLGRGYIENWFECDKLTELISICTNNIKEIKNLFYANFILNFIHIIKNFFKKNTLSQSKKNIEYHYDIGNDFYFKWLDETKTYSSGIFINNCSLEEAQKNKYHNIIRHLKPETKTILEIGCGWGGFIKEVTNTIKDVKIKGLTLSKEQFSYCKEAFKENQNVELAVQDYRSETAKYDAIVSIEMFEAVGMKYWKTYFDKIYSCLNTGGIAIIQVITIADDAFERYSKSSDFIRHFIFPGGMLPSKTIFKEYAQKANLKIKSFQNFGMSYYKTLTEWLKKFDSNAEYFKIVLKMDEKFIRKWRFYLALCAGAFYTKRSDVFQFLLEKNE